ncbi:MAG: hypothetical protein RLZZ450_3694 [Pseudomonadota bacterium]|jgi:hypothetical protein
MLVAVAALLLFTEYVPREPVDDAGISVAYARTFVAGGGFRVTPESAVAEGFSNPTWTFLLAALEVFDIDSLAWVRWLGTAFGALALLFVTYWGPAAERRKLQLEDSIAPLVACAHSSLGHWVQGGLETGLQIFGIGLLAFVALGPQTRRTAVLFGASTALVTLTRPEAPLYAAAAGSGWLLNMCVDRRKPGRIDLIAIVVALVPIAGYLAFRRAYFGEWFPNTYFAKKDWEFLDGDAYLRNYWITFRPLCIATLWALPFAWLGGARAAVRSFVCVALLGTVVYFAHHAHGDWMREWRFFSLLAPLHGAAIAVGVSGLRVAVRRVLVAWGSDASRARTISLQFGLFFCALAFYKLVPFEIARVSWMRGTGYDVPIRIVKGGRMAELDARLAPFKMTHPLVLASDMGVIGIGMPEAELWDFAGLTDPAISRHFGKVKMFEDYMANEGPPSLVLAWGPGNFFSGTEYAHATYDDIGNGQWFLKGLTPDQDPRCPDGKATVLAQSVPALRQAMLDETRGNDPALALRRWRCAYTYRADKDLPTRAQRAEVARAAEQLGALARSEKKRRLALRHYSLCAVIGSKEVRLSVRCRKQAEQLRERILYPTKRPPIPPPK